MTMAKDGDVFLVEAPARLHFGVLDLSGVLGRWFGGIGAAAPDPTVLVAARASDELCVTGEDAPRALEFARRFLSSQRLPERVHLEIRRSLPPHAGLGSGTQLALAVARAVAEVYGLALPAAELARAAGRAERSAIGTWIFDGGGFVLEGGRKPNGQAVAPLLARLPLPAAWHCVVVVPHGVSGISGMVEATAFSELPRAPEEEARRVAHLTLMALLPAIVDADLATFGAALSEIQIITGRWFAPIQGGTFAAGPSAELVRRLSEWGAVGVGQSSWGPTVYGVVTGSEAGKRLAERVERAVGGDATVYEGPFRPHGARIFRATR
jgi:beta-RFAP synthase